MSALDLWRQAVIRRAWARIAAAVDRSANPLPAKPLRSDAERRHHNRLLPAAR
jgi:hypothetical protein